MLIKFDREQAVLTIQRDDLKALVHYVHTGNDVYRLRASIAASRIGMYISALEQAEQIERKRLIQETEENDTAEFITTAAT